MLITFVNLPFDICWNEGVKEMFDVEIESILGKRADTDECRVSEHNSKVHVIVSEVPGNFEVFSRKAVAKQIFLFLKFHAVLEDSDIFFCGFDAEKYFDDRFYTPNDFEM